ncbi:MAG: hypothetical protein QNJ46_24660 [Leptolyngbyaceae cyanobacterium MO_188.B28]|nr:hypothetical protein [Leptolyngbyaceae cyanobacterium MO_188.B28]
MKSEDLEGAKVEYAYGQAAFEGGEYRQSIQHLEEAAGLVNKLTPFGGEIQIWLVTAYDAAARHQDAIALCSKLCRHPDFEIRKQSRQLLYILEAPKLKTRPEWLTKIPDLESISEETNDAFKGGGRYAQISPRKSRKSSNAEPEPIDPSQVNTQDNQFIWFALIGVVFILGSLVWLG